MLGQLRRDSLRWNRLHHWRIRPGSMSRRRSRQCALASLSAITEGTLWQWPLLRDDSGQTGDLGDISNKESCYRYYVGAKIPERSCARKPAILTPSEWR